MTPSLVIALHGLGATGEDLMPLPHMMGLTDVPWLFPNAPLLPVTVNGGARMPAWFDILGFGPDDTIDTQGIRRSAQTIQALIAEQLAKGVDSSGIVLLGFSQGGVIALHTALSSITPVGAVVGLSTWLPAYEQLAPVKAVLQDTPVWLGHGRYDTVVPVAAYERAQARLMQLGVRHVHSHIYPMAHSILEEELADVSAWLLQQ